MSMNRIKFFVNGVDIGTCVVGTASGRDHSPLVYSAGADPFYYADDAHRGKVTDWTYLRECCPPRKHRAPWAPRDPILEQAVGNFEKRKQGLPEGRSLFYSAFE